MCGRLWFHNPCLVDEGSMEDLSHHHGLIAGPLTHRWKESFTCIKAEASKQQLCFFLHFLSLPQSLTPSLASIPSPMKSAQLSN